jgi:quinol monooxygenase YgiN
MVTHALLVNLEAKPGKEDTVERFLASALTLVDQEPGTTAWFALRLGPSTFGIFDAFPDVDSRDAHLSGAVAKALMEQADDLFSTAPDIKTVDVIADKLPG